MTEPTYTAGPGQISAPQSQSDPGPPRLPPTGRKPMSPIAIAVFSVVATVVVIGLVAVGVTVLVSRASDDTSASKKGIRPTALEKAVSGCTANTVSAVIGDEGRTVRLDGRGEDDINGLTYSEVTCIVTAVKMPASVQGQFGATRALDGMQQASWDGYEATWNYHPDSGPNVTITMTSASK